VILDVRGVAHVASDTPPDTVRTLLRLCCAACYGIFFRADRGQRTGARPPVGPVIFVLNHPNGSF